MEKIKKIWLKMCKFPDFFNKNFNFITILTLILIIFWLTMSLEQFILWIILSVFLTLSVNFRLYFVFKKRKREVLKKHGIKY